MKAIELPILLRTTDCVAVTLEQAELACQPVWVVSVRERVSASPRRRWFPSSADALAYAAEQADRYGLLLIDLRDSGDQP